LLTLYVDFHLPNGAVDIWTKVVLTQLHNNKILEKIAYRKQGYCDL